VSDTLTLREQLVRLVGLQELDLKIDQLNKQKNSLPAALKALDDQLATLGKQLTAKGGALEEIQKKERQSRAALEMSKERETRANEKLSAVANTGEFQAANREIDQLKKHNVTLDAQLKALSAEAETASGEVKKIQAQMEELRAKRETESQKISGEGTQLAGQVAELTGKRSEFTPGVERRIMALYDRVRAGRAGIGIAPAVAGRCGVCNMVVPPQMYNELQKGKELHSCPSCQRILYVPNSQA
jgi:predicted  nucleic acid-binding Zn-ribbon protein